MNPTVARNIQLFLEVKGKRKDWVMKRLGLDENSFEQLIRGEEKGLVHVEKLAKLFRKDVSYFYNEKMKLPLTFQESRELDRIQTSPAISDISQLVFKMQGIEDDLLQAEGIMNDIEENLNESLVKEIGQLLHTLELKSKQLVMEAQGKEVKKYNT